MAVKIDWSRMKVSDSDSDAGSGNRPNRKLGVGLLLLLVILILISLVLAVWWSGEPDHEQTRLAAIEMSGGEHAKTGSLTTSSLISVVDLLLEKPVVLSAMMLLRPAFFWITCRIGSMA